MRKSKLTPARKEKIIELISQGNTKEIAAAVAGITSQTLYNWIARGREEEEPEGLEDMSNKNLKKLAKHHSIKGYSKMNKEQLVENIREAATIYRVFAEEMERAEAAGLAEHVRNVRTAGGEDWRASAWFLERRDPANWAKRERLQVDNNHSGSIDTNQKLDLSKLTDEELSELESIVTKFADPGTA